MTFVTTELGSIYEFNMVMSLIWDMLWLDQYELYGYMCRTRFFGYMINYA